LDQLVTTVARVPFQLDLRDAVKAQRSQERERVCGELRNPARLGDACSADLARRLAELTAREQTQFLAVRCDVRADSPERVVAARNPLLHERAEVTRVVEVPFELSRRRATKRLHTEVTAERRGLRRLDQHRKPECVRRLV